LLKSSGYIRGIENVAEHPSVAHLNFFVATGLVTMLVGFLLKGLPEYHALHLNMEELELVKSTATTRPFCSVCGENSDLVGSGRFLRLEDFIPQLTLMPEVKDSHDRTYADSFPPGRNMDCGG
jgi:hypothetical protein